MEETLRYFFSAVFQGIAAIIALGSMFFIYDFDKIENQKKVIENFLKNNIKAPGLDDKFDLSNIGIIEYSKRYVDEYADNSNYKTAQKLCKIYEIKLKEFERLEEKERIINHFPSFLKLAITILILSLISLFLVGYNCYLNYFLIFIGIIVIIMTILYLKKLYRLIITILDIKSKNPAR